MSTRQVTVCVAGVLLLAGVTGPATGLGAAPVFERITVDDSFVDTDLSEACGVPVTGRVTGHVTLRTFGADSRVISVNSINVGVVETSGDRTFRFRDVGADVARVAQDGTVVLLISGQVPFAFAGALKINPDTGEVILEPKDRSEAQLAKACAALAG